MLNNFKKITKCPLFENINEHEIKQVLECLKINFKFYSKGNSVMGEGDLANFFGIVISGMVNIEQTDFNGNRNIVATIMPYDIFGESFAFANIDKLPVNVIAAVDSKIILINSNTVLNMCNKNCEFHYTLIKNLLKITANKNLYFNKKIAITSKRTTRDKLITYLSFEQKRNKSDTFEIPYNRQDLADFLQVERSGLSTEIGKLVKEKIIICNHNKFTIL